MDHLRDGIGLRAVGQRDPLVEYQREAYNAFADIQARIKEESVGYIFNLPVRKEGEATAEAQAKPASPRPRIARPSLDGAANRPMDAQFSYSSAKSGDAAPKGSGASYSVAGGGSTGAAAPGSAKENAAAAAQQAGTIRNDDKTGRNDPCPCGSGQKYKKCHGA